MSKRQRQMQAQLDNLTMQLEDERQQHINALAAERLTKQQERTERTAAQDGLLVYVRNLEELGRRIQAYPAMFEEFPLAATLYEQLTYDLRELGLLGVKVGYDHHRDINLTVVGAQRS